MTGLSWFEKWWINAWPHRLHIHHRVPAFLKAAPEPFRGEVLEVGAGHGWSSRRMLDTYPQIELTAIDSDEKVVANFTKLSSHYGQRLEVRQAYAEQLPFDRNTFDIVVAMHSLHHVDNLEQAIREIMRVVRPGGLIGIVDENQKHLVGPLKWLFPSRHNIDRNDVIELLEQEGVEVKVAGGNAHFFIWAQQPYPYTT